MQAPERFLVAHPVQPGVPAAAGRAGRRARRPPPRRSKPPRAFFTYIGMHPLRVRREVPGHLTDRLQEALWREILHMVNEDVATTGELDDSIVYGPGLRWAAMGTNLIYHLAGGETGMRHMLRQFGPVPEMALDQARGARADRGTDRQDGRRHAGAGGGPLDPRARAAARRLPGRHPAGAQAVRHRRRRHAARPRGAAVRGRRRARRSAPASSGGSAAARCCGWWRRKCVRSGSTTTAT